MADSNTPKGSGEKVQLDDFESSFEAGTSSRKVELDLDDAPFLDWEADEGSGEDAEEREPVEAEADQEEEDGEIDARPWWQRWWWAFLLAATMATLAALAYVLLCRTDIPGGAHLQGSDSKGGTFQKKPSEPIKSDLTPFLIEFSSGSPEADFRYLHFACALYTKNRKVAAELGARRTELREVIYDYLQSKDRLLMADKRNMEDLKKGLLQAVNARIEAGRFEEVLIQEYLVY